MSSQHSLLQVLGGPAPFLAVDPSTPHCGSVVPDGFLAADTNSAWAGVLPCSKACDTSRFGRYRIHSTLIELGREVLGPAFCVFVDLVHLRAQALGIERLFFVARDGYVFQRIYEALYGPSPSHRYLHLSRFSTALPSIRQFGLREIHQAWKQTPSPTVRKILQFFDLADPTLLRGLAAAGVDDLDSRVTNWWSDHRFHLLLEEPVFQRDVTSRAASARELLRRFLVQEQLFSARRVALVDIGWRGSIQDNLLWAFGEDPDYPDLRGFYFGLGPLAYQDDAASRWRHQKEGLLSDWRQCPQPSARALFAFLEIFEQAARAGHGTTLGYRQEGGYLVPVLKESGPDRQAEQLIQPAVEALQRGILSFAEGYRSWLSRHGGDVLLARKETWRRVDRFVFAPTAKEIAALSELTHSDDGGSNSTRRLVGEEHPSLLLSPHNWLDQFHRASWKPSVLIQTGGPLLARLYREYLRFRPDPR